MARWMGARVGREGGKERGRERSSFLLLKERNCNHHPVSTMGAGQLVLVPTRTLVNSYLIKSYFIFPWSTCTLCLWSTRTF